MGKMLILKDYEDIVKKGFIQCKSENDFYKYYLNIIEENYSSNSDILEQLKRILKSWIEWYEQKNYAPLRRTLMQDGTVQWMRENETFYFDENRQRVTEDSNAIRIPLFIENTRLQINKHFFTEQLKMIEIISDIEKVKQTIDSYEKSLPLEFKKTIASIKKPGFDLQEIQQWFNTVSQIHTEYEQTKNKVKEHNGKLKIDQIALKYVYEEQQITRENGNEIAKQYGHNSGEKLFQRYIYYSSLANRKGKPNPFTPIRITNKINLFESVIKLLPENKKAKAIDELKILKTIYDSECL